MRYLQKMYQNSSFLTSNRYRKKYNVQKLLTFNTHMKYCMHKFDLSQLRNPQ